MILLYINFILTGNLKIHNFGKKGLSQISYFVTSPKELSAILDKRKDGIT